MGDDSSVSKAFSVSASDHDADILGDNFAEIVSGGAV